MNKMFFASASPHIHSSDDTAHIMRRVIFSLIPVILSAVYFFGFAALALILMCTTGSLIMEYVSQKLRKRPTSLLDGSAVITGILLALTLPPSFPLWAAALGSIIAISLGKHIFGGLGYNIFNPALVGRAFLQAAFPVLMTTWTPPVRTFGMSIDGLSVATPLAVMKFQHIPTDWRYLILGNTGGSLGETSTLAVIVGGAFLIWKKDADFRIILGIVLASLFLLLSLWLAAPDKFMNPIFHLLSGGFMLGAFFMATDMVTSPVSKTGRWIFGIGIGFLIVLIRSFSGLPEGVMYSILLMNSLVPLIDRYAPAHVFGETRGAST
jgi:electron transport complex protein RnfD